MLPNRMPSNLHKSAYQPAEDTFLLASVVESYEGEIALEMGVGSGYVTVELGGRTRLVVGTDLSVAAMRETQARLRENGLRNAELVRCDRASPFRSRPFDLVVFNPPYLPSGAEKDIAVDGGRKGIAATMEFLEHVFAKMKRSGRVLFVTSTLSEYRKIFESLRARGFKRRVVKRRRLFFEELMVIEALR